MTSKKMKLLVLSCDKYSDLWPVFFSCLKMNIDTNRVDIYLGTNSLEYHDPQVKVIKSGPDLNWSSSAKSILTQIKDEYIFIILEDLIPISEIDCNRLNNLFHFLKSNDGNYLRYWAKPKPQKSSLVCDDVFVSENFSPYRINVCGIWKRQTFINLLIDGESPWNFEIMGSYRSSYMNGFFTTQTDLFKFKNLVEKGKWIRKSIRWARANSIAINTATREFNNFRSEFFRMIFVAYFNIVIRIPWKLRVFLLNTFRKLFISY